MFRLFWSIRINSADIWAFDLNFTFSFVDLTLDPLTLVLGFDLIGYHYIDITGNFKNS